MEEGKEVNKGREEVREMGEGGKEVRREEREEEYMYTVGCSYTTAEHSLLLKVGSTSLVVQFLSPSLWEGSSASGRGAVLRGDG